MPPKGKLSDEILQDFETWIKQGAADPREGGQLVSKTEIDFAEAGNFWAFQKPVKSKLPKIRNKAWMAHPIDRYVAADLAKNRLSVSDSGEQADFDPPRVLRLNWFTTHDQTADCLYK